MRSEKTDEAAHDDAHRDGRPVAAGAGLRRDRWAVLGLIALCVATRLATTIYYVEDPDSLHFALSMVDFDVARLQPHFPGYVVFVGLARALAAMTGSFAVAFSLVGAIATSLIVLALLALARTSLATRRGAIVAAVVLGTGMLWLYANRYMPDLLGVALLLWSLHDLADDDDRTRMRGALAAALLAGTRLSYLPFLLPVVIHAVAWRPRRMSLALAFAAGIALWAIPLVALTGWSELVAIAANQTTGHFDEFGGTIRTEPNIGMRLGRMVEGIWTDALGGYWPGRSPLTLLTGAIALAALTAASPLAGRALGSTRWRLVAAGAATYLLWIFLYQNVIHHSRHLLPLVPLIALAVAVGIDRIAARGRAGLAVAVSALAAIALLGATLAWGHRRPSAIAQVSRTLAATSASPATTGAPLAGTGAPLAVVSTGLVNDFLLATGVRARFLAVDRPGFADSLRAMPPQTRVVSVGDYRAHLPISATASRRFYHNPHINRIWPVVELYDYGTAGGAR